MKISNREKIILGITALAAIWAGGTFLRSGSDSGDSPPGTDREELQQIVLEAAGSLASGSLTDTEKAVLERARIPWPDAPFVTAAVGRDETEAASGSSGEALPPFVFSGYIETGSIRLAIINGDEYTRGDRITGTAFSVRSISRQRVLLADTDNNEVAVSLTAYPATAPAPQQSQ